ncbi:hypothetical protein DUNSADRAFT_6532 [Dunaliella salina]|uniref:Uncharacterized protein n=1 Tax=Dunaliella salina TaxID=3046 RepID=A0ABQ7GN93_DUNSA|nr:hypothetical protein DUNSADRAFT_6532 [Dunaliella salina]|eukprot:KAF5836062.1 hypothetical protein DUNSADRAFT_6532 [Dunaliella salina]
MSLVIMTSATSLFLEVGPSCICFPMYSIQCNRVLGFRFAGIFFDLLRSADCFFALLALCPAYAFFPQIFFT